MCVAPADRGEGGPLQGTIRVRPKQTPWVAKEAPLRSAEGEWTTCAVADKTGACLEFTVPRYLFWQVLTSNGASQKPAISRCASSSATSATPRERIVKITDLCSLDTSRGTEGRAVSCVCTIRYIYVYRVFTQACTSQRFPWNQRMHGNNETVFFYDRCDTVCSFFVLRYLWRDEGNSITGMLYMFGLICFRDYVLYIEWNIFIDCSE